MHFADLAKCLDLARSADREDSELRRQIGKLTIIALTLSLVAAAPAAAATRHGGARTTASISRHDGGSTTAGTVNGGGSGSEATFNGQTIDLANGWDGAQACLILESGTTQCYSTLADAQAAANVISQQEVAGASGSNARRASVKSVGAARAHSSCQGNSGEWLWLYQNVNYTGQAIGIQETNVWVDLQDEGFGDEMSSYANDTACQVAMSKSTNGSGSQLVVAAWASSANVGSNWNDQVNAVVIED